VLVPLFGVAFVLGSSTLALSCLIAWQKGALRALFAMMWFLVFLWSLGLRL